MSSGGNLDAQFRDTLIGTTAAPGLGFSLMGETVTHTASKTPGVAAVATVVTAVRVPTSDVTEKDTEEQTKWVVSAADFAADPRNGDTITDDAGIIWGVVRVTPQVGGQFELTTISAQEV